MSRFTIRTGTPTEFFQRGRMIAQLVDQSKPISAESIITYEDPEDVLKLLTAGRLALFRAIKDHPGSISAISRRLHRDRDAVKRDVDQLAKVGLVIIESRVLPGHGRIKEVSVAAQQFRLEVMFA